MRGKNVARCLTLLFVCTLLVGCSVPQDWGNDPLVLDELQLLEENDLWVELFSHPAEPAPCNIAICQNVLSSEIYEVVGDPDEAKVAAINELLRDWVPTSSADPFTVDSSDFQLRRGIEIDTTTGTAFLSVRFMTDVPDGPENVVADAITFVVTSDIDPNWLQDRVFETENLPTLVGFAVVLLSLGVMVNVRIAPKRS